MAVRYDVPVVIAAAGSGSRLGLGIPKCLVEVDGRTILDRQLDLVRSHRDVRIVVGFHSADVRAAVVASGADVTVVENTEWASTNTLASLELATRDLTGNCVILDGDLIVDMADFARFSNVMSESPSACIAITPSGTEDGVFVDLASAPDDEGRTEVLGFRREPADAYEWSGLAQVDTGSLWDRDGWVYECLEPLLPLRAVVVRAWEVDTPGDLERAEREIVRCERSR